MGFVKLGKHYCFVINTELRVRLGLTTGDLELNYKKTTLGVQSLRGITSADTV
jgi:hypothetical protein